MSEGIQINLISRERLAQMTPKERISFIVDEIKNGKVLVLERGLTAKEELELIRVTMSEIDHESFIGVETPGFSIEHRKRGLFDRLLGRAPPPRMMVVGPAHLLRTIKKDGEMVQAMIVTKESMGQMTLEDLHAKQDAGELPVPPPPPDMDDEPEAGIPDEDEDVPMEPEGNEDKEETEEPEEASEDEPAEEKEDEPAENTEEEPTTGSPSEDDGSISDAPTSSPVTKGDEPAETSEETPSEDQPRTSQASKDEESFYIGSSGGKKKLPDFIKYTSLSERIRMDPLSNDVNLETIDGLNEWLGPDGGEE